MTTYWQSPAGAFFVLEDGDGGDPGWTELTETAYNSALAAAGSAIDATIAANKTSNDAAVKHAYDTLKASAHTVDWDENTFRFLTGYTGA